MKILKNFILLLLCLVLLCNCKSPDNDPAIQAELDKLKGIWKIDSFNFENVPEQSKKIFSGGNLKFNILTYNPKYSSPTKISISGDIQIGEVFYSISTYYDSEKKIHNKFTLGGRPEYHENLLKYDKENRIIIPLWIGDWNIQVTGNTMTAKQITNTQTPDARLGFTATRQ